MSNNDLNGATKKSTSGIVIGKIKEPDIKEYNGSTNSNTANSNTANADIYQEKVIRLLESIHSMIKFFYVITLISLIVSVVFLIAIFNK